MKTIIFTDLDGSLLNHEDYTYEEARPTLDRIKGAGIPLVMTTSKTRVEVEVLQREMGIEEPFIVENGAAVFFPLGYRGFNRSACEIRPPYALIRIGKPYAEIRGFIQERGAAFGIRGFGDFTTEEVSRLADLSPEKAALAKQREFTEPFLLPGEADLQGLCAMALRAGMKVLKGGRFYHLVGLHQDKGEAVRIAKRLFSVDHREPVKTIGVGDSLNDLPMLEEVDIPVLIPHPDGTYEKMTLPNLRRAVSPGSRGWQESMDALLDEGGVPRTC
jgi:mannosyl-3-phosphoglycerate phosphatase